MQCPRCQAAITASPDASGAIVCAGCGAKLLTRAAAAARATGATAKTPAGAPPLPEMPNPGSLTLPPGTPLKNIARPEEPRATSAQIEAVLAELRALRSIQEDIVELLRSRTGAPGIEPLGADALASMEETKEPPPVLRGARQRKTVLLVDDDEAERQKAVAEMERAEVPVRAFGEGTAALEAIAEEKPDVIVLELDLRGRMAGKDVINMIKATMEWVDIPIVLYTRLPVESQREARTVHGADEFVLKTTGPATLVARCIALFRKG
jgi:CheY-like chemotaxis protein